jgi:hypothetical protein
MRSRHHRLVRKPARCSFRHRIAVAVLVAAALCAVSATSASAYTKENCWWPRVERGQSIPWTNYSSGADKSAWFSAKDAWDATPTKVSISGSGTYINGNSANFGNTGWAGKTYWTCSNGVFQAPVNSYINDYYGDSGFALTEVATHEFGHALGLGHSTTCYTIMYTDPTACGPVTPKQDDINGLNAIYP